MPKNRVRRENRQKDKRTHGHEQKERQASKSFQQAYLHGKPFFIRGQPAEDLGDLNGMRAFWCPNDVNRPHGAGNMEVIPYSQLRKDAPECVEFELPAQT